MPGISNTLPSLRTSAPYSLIMCDVTSRYGADTGSPSIVMTDPSLSRGAVSIRDVMNWELTLPSMETGPPRFGPCTVTGGSPPLEEQATPQVPRACRRGPMGLFLRDSSPVMVTGRSNDEHMPVRILMVVPEFMASIGAAGALRSPPSTVASCPSSDTDAPIALQASMVASVSADSRQFESSERPSAIEARNTARCVWLLDGGGDILPDISPPRNAMLVIRRTSWLS